MGANPSVMIAFVAGILSFLSPCCLPLYPSYLSYMAGITTGDSNESQKAVRIRVLIHALLFVFGFSIVFFALGMSATLIGSVFSNYRNVIRVVGGLIVFCMGAILTGMMPLRLMFSERKWHYRRRRLSYLSSVLIGVSFSAGWTPCIGPILASVLVLTASESAHGVVLILTYIAGFAIPFLVLGLTVSSFRKWMKASAWLSRVGGIVMMCMGVLLATNALSVVTIWLIRIYGGFVGL